MAIMLVLFIILCAIISVDFHQNNLIQPEKGTKLIYLSKNVLLIYFLIYLSSLTYSLFWHLFFLSAILLEKQYFFYELSYIPGKNSRNVFFMAILFRPFSLIFVQLFLYILKQSYSIKNTALYTYIQGNRFIMKYG